MFDPDAKETGMEIGTLVAGAILGSAIAAVVAYNTFAAYVIVKRRYFAAPRDGGGSASAADDEGASDTERAFCPDGPCEECCC